MLHMHLDLLNDPREVQTLLHLVHPFCDHFCSRSLDAASHLVRSFQIISTHHPLLLPLLHQQLLHHLQLHQRIILIESLCSHQRHDRSAQQLSREPRVLRRLRGHPGFLPHGLEPTLRASIQRSLREIVQHVRNAFLHHRLRNLLDQVQQDRVVVRLLFLCISGVEAFLPNGRDRR